MNDGTDALNDTGDEDGLSAAEYITKEDASQSTKDTKEGVQRDDGSCNW